MTAEIGSEIGFDFNTAADDFFQEADGFGDVLIEIDVAGLQNLAAGEGEELASERGSANGLMANFIEVAMEASFGVGLVHAEFGPAENGADHVVEIVGDAAGQLADGFEFLGLTDLFFQREAFGNFLDDDLGAFGLAARIAGPAGNEAHGDDFAVAAFPIDTKIGAVGGAVGSQDLAA